MIKELMGAGIGALSQDPLDNPIAGMVGAGIGGYAAYNMVYYKRIKPMSAVGNIAKYDRNLISSIAGKKEMRNNVTSGVRGRIASMKYNDRKIEKLNKTIIEIKGHIENAKLAGNESVLGLHEANLLDKESILMEALQKRSDQETKRSMAIHNINTLLSHRGITTENPVKDYSDVRALLKASPTDETYRAIHDALPLNVQLDSVDPVYNRTPQSRAVTKIGIGIPESEKIAQLSNHFQKIMGHNKEDADRKARGIVSFMGNQEFHMNDNMLTVNLGGKTREMPLTVHTKGTVRFSKIDNTFYASKRVNPFMGLLTNDPTDITDKAISNTFGTANVQALAKKEYDAEELLQLFGNTYEDKAVAFDKANEYVRSMHEFTMAESNLGDKSLAELTRMNDNDFNMHTKYVSTQSVEFMKTLRKTDEGFRLGDVDKIGKTTNGVPGQSEMARIYETMHYTFNSNPLEGQGVNIIGRYTSMINGKGGSIPNAIFPTAERGSDTQLLRPYIDSKYHQAGRFDIDKNVGRWISRQFGGQLSIDDGSGIVNADFMARMNEAQYQRFTIPRSPTGKFITNEHISSILKETDPAEKARLMAMSIKNDDVLGFDINKKKITVGSVYSDATVNDISIDHTGMHITLKSTFKGSEEEWMKLFGVSSKAGYSKASSDVFNKIQAMQQSIYFGVANINEDGVAMVNRKGATQELADKMASIGMSVDDYMSYFRDTMMGAPIKDEHLAISKMMLSTQDIILGKQEAGNDILGDMLNPETMSRAKDKLAKQIADSPQTKPNAEFTKHLGVIQDASNVSYLENAKAAMFMLAQTDFKGNADIATTLGHLIETKQLDKGLKVDLDSLRGGERFVKDYSGATAALDRVINATISDKTDLMGLRTYVKADMGEGLHGIGNTGSMSWIEREQLLASGFTQEMIDEISTPNNDALFEMRSIQSMESEGSMLSHETKVANAKELYNIFDSNMEARKSTITKIAGDVGDSFSYGLTLPHDYGGVIKSVPISLIETNRSGHFEQETETLLKSLDKARKNVVQKDIEYTKATDINRKAMAESYRKALEEMEAIHAKLLKGDGNLIKSASKRRMDGSSFMTARSIGGEFADLMSTRALPGVAMSQETIHELARKSGHKIEFRSVGNGISQAFIDGTDNPFMALASREPAQGAYSVFGIEVFHDANSVLGKNHVGVANMKDNSNNMFHKGMMLDFDYDTLKISNANFKSPEAQDVLRKINEQYASTFQEAKVMIGHLTQKGKNNSKAMLGAFATSEDYLSHQMFSGYKGKQRKFLASHSTDMAMNMTEALQRHLKSLGLEEDEFARRSIMGRTLIHNMTEAMIKSAHRSSTEIKDSGAVSPIEHMKAAYDDLVKGDSSEYETKMRASTAKLFNADFEKGSAAEVSYNSALDDVISGTISHGQEIESQGGRIQDSRGTRTMADVLSNLSDFAKSGSIPAEPYEGMEAKQESAKRYGKSVYHNMKRNMLANKKQLIAGGLALAATASVLGAQKPETTKESLPFETSDGILPPLQSESAHVYKKQAFKQTTTVNGNAHEQGMRRSEIQKRSFGHKDQGRTNINIRDKRERSH